MENLSPQHSLSLSDLAALFGTDVEALSQQCDQLLDLLPLYYQPMDQLSRDRHLLHIIRQIQSDDLPAAGHHRHDDWEAGWAENLDLLRRNSYTQDALIPKYYKPWGALRLNGDLVEACTEHLVYKVTHIFRTWLFKTFLNQVDNIYEFGCGSGFHVAWLARLFPEKQINGLDWARSSQKILDELKKNCGMNIHGEHFNFFEPDTSIKIEPRSGLLTFGALEQAGKRFRPFLDFILAKAPEICVNVECLDELYNPDLLPDYLALAYHRRRGYLEGYLTALKELECQKRIQIIKIHRQPFGNLYNDTHSYVIWRPIARS